MTDTIYIIDFYNGIIPFDKKQIHTTKYFQGSHEILTESIYLKRLSVTLKQPIENIIKIKFLHDTYDVITGFQFRNKEYEIMFLLSN